MGFDDILGNTSPGKQGTVVTVSVDVAIHPPYDEKSDEAIEFIATNTAAKQLWRQMFDKHPDFRDLVIDDMVDTIGMMPANSDWTQIVDKILEKLFE